MTSKVIVFIGGSSGLGFNALTQLLDKGVSYKVILGSRAPLPAPQYQKLEPLLKKSSSTLERLEIELTSFKSIAAFCDTLKKTHPEEINHLVLCAGIIPGYFSKTEDGNERGLQVNVLSQALILELLHPKLAAEARVLFVGTSLHRRVLPGVMEPSKIDAILENPFVPMQDYLNTKFVQMYLFLLTTERFAPDPRKIRALIVSPGFVPDTGLVRELSMIKRLFMQNVAPKMIFVTTPDQAGKTICRGLTDDLTSGTYYSKRKIENAAEEIYDPELQQKWREFLIARKVWELK